MIVDKLIETVKEDASIRSIADIRVGIGYTTVLLDDGSCGLTFTFRSELGPTCGLVEEAGNLIGVGCEEIVRWAMDTNLVKSAIGLAVINAILQQRLEGFSRGDVIEKIDVRPGDVLGMIGYFKPVMEKFTGRAKQIYVFERNITDDRCLLPDWAEDIYLPECDVVVITGTTLLNKTMDHILEKSRKAREIVVMGPTASLCPEVFKEHGVTMLAGAAVADPQRVLRIASQGGGGLSLGDSVSQVYRQL